MGFCQQTNLYRVRHVDDELPEFIPYSPFHKSFDGDSAMLVRAFSARLDTGEEV